MDVTTVGLFLLATFAGAVATGLSGFALGLVAAGVWLHILSPAQTAALIVFYGLPMQSYWLWRLRHALVWRRVMPFMLGGLFGVPLSVMLLSNLTPGQVRVGVGTLLVLYSTYGLARPNLKPVHSNFFIDTLVGFFNGLVGGMTGLVGPVITMWCSMRGWSKDEQRAVFHPVIIAAYLLTAFSLAMAGEITMTVATYYAMGLPVLIFGAWIGLLLYGKLDDAGFRRVVLVLLLASGLVLLGGQLL